LLESKEAYNVGVLPDWNRFYGWLALFNIYLNCTDNRLHYIVITSYILKLFYG